MSEPFVGNEMSEELESTEDLSRETRELNEITNEPESYIEGKIDVAQSEAIESSFNELVDNQVSGGEAEMPALDGSSKPKLDSADEFAESNPVPIPKEGPEGAGDDFAGTMPAQPPEGADEGETVAMKFAPEGGSEEVSPLPTGSGGDASIDPKPILSEAGEVGEEEESFVKGSEEPAPIDSLDDLQSLALQQQITQQNREFTIVSVIMHSSGDTAKNSINNIR
jgi:hypothetical protein